MPTIVTGFVVAIPALFLNLTMVTDLCSIGTLFAFVLVCAGVLVLQNKPGYPKRKIQDTLYQFEIRNAILIIIGLALLLLTTSNHQ